MINLQFVYIWEKMNISKPFSWSMLAAIAWIIWVMVWTIGLLRPEPIAMRDAVVPSALAFWVSKTMHVVGYAALVAWPAIQWRKQWFLVGLGGLLHGAATETLQPFCGRNGTPVDVAWNAAGIMLGIYPSFWINRSSRKNGDSGPRA